MREAPGREAGVEPRPVKTVPAHFSPVYEATEEDVDRYCRDIMNRLFALQIVHRKEELLGQLQRLGPEGDHDEFLRINGELMELEAKRRALRAD